MKKSTKPQTRIDQDDRVSTEEPTTRQVKFECSAAFHQRLMDEKLQRNLTVQQLAIRALERYFAFPESVHRGIEEQAAAARTELTEYLRQMMRDLNALVHPHGLTREPAMLRAEAVLMRNALEAVVHFLEQMPIEKVNSVREALALDLKYYRSSRLKRSRSLLGGAAVDRQEAEGEK